MLGTLGMVEIMGMVGARKPFRHCVQAGVVGVNMSVYESVDPPSPHPKRVVVLSMA